MKSNLTRRDLAFFILGVLFMFSIVLIYEWKDFKSGFSGAWKNNTEISK